jgi:hypothetical protein
MTAHHLERDRRAQKADRRAHARPFGNDHAADPELLGEPPRVQRRAAAERDHRVTADHAAALDRVHARGVGHVLLDDLRHARRVPGRGEPERRADVRRHRPVGGRGVERQRAVREALRVDAPEHEVGVGHRSVDAAAPVRGRPGIGAGAVRPHRDALHAVDARDRATAGADLDHLDHRHAHRKTAALHVPVGARHLERTRALGLTAVDQADLRGGAAHVERQHALERALARDPGREQRAAGGSGLDQPHREARRDLERGEPAARHHQQQRARHAERVQLGAQPEQIALHHRPHVRVGAGGREALVLADLRAHLARKADGDVGRELSAQDLGGALLVLRPGIGVHEADRDRVDPLGGKALADRTHRALVELAQNAPAAVEASGHREAQGARDEWERAFHVDVVLLEALLVSHFEDVAQALGGDECGPGALALDERVRRQGSSVDEDGNFRRRKAGSGEHAPNAFQHAHLRRRRRQHLDRVAARRALEDHVGERAADVGRQPRAHHTETFLNRGSRHTSVSST